MGTVGLCLMIFGGIGLFAAFLWLNSKIRKDLDEGQRQGIGRRYMLAVVVSSVAFVGGAMLFRFAR